VAREDRVAEHKILVVEDDAGLRELICEVLMGKGMEAFQSANGRHALRRIHGCERFDAILTDIVMPELDGLAFLRSLRENSIHTPVVILSGFGNKAAVLEALRLGAYDFFEKPCDLLKLADVVMSAAEIGAAMRQLVSAVRVSEVDEVDVKSRGEVLRTADEVVRIALAHARLVIEQTKKVS